MRILYTLLGILVARLVRCGDCDNDNRGTLKGAEKQNPPESTHSESSLTSKVDTSLFNVDECEEDGLKVLKLKAKEGTSTNKLLYDGQDVWQGRNPDDSCSVATFYMGEKEPIAVLYRFKRASDGKLVEGYRQFSDGNWSQVKKDDLTKLLEEVKPRNDDTQNESILALAKSKIDSSLFDAFGSVEEHVNVLKLTPKVDKVTHVTYDKKQIWSGKVRIGTSSTLVEALLYFNEETPELVTIKAVKGGKESMVYRYYDGSKWKDDKEEEHKTKFGELKRKAPKTPSIIAPPNDNFPVIQSVGNSSNLPSSNQDTLDLEKPGLSSYSSFGVNIQGVPAKVYVSMCGNIIKKVTNGNEVVWTATSKETGVYCIAFLKSDKLSTVVVQIKMDDGKITYVLSECNNGKWEVPAGYPVSHKVNALKPKSSTLTKLSLDISLAESNDDCTVENSEDSGIKIRLYAPKNGKAIEQVMDGKTAIGKLKDGVVCYLCELYSKCNTKLLRVHTEAAGYEVYLSHYMNSGSGWNVIEEKEFGTKLKDMKK